MADTTSQIPPAGPVDRPAWPAGGETARAAPAAPARPGVEARTQFAPDSRRLITDILDPTTREVLYRIPPQLVTDAAVRASEALSRYERLMTSVAPARTLRLRR